MISREKILELVRIGKHEDCFRELYQRFDTLLESLQRLAQSYKSSAEISFYYKILKNLKQIEKNYKQIKEEDIKFMNESRVDKILKMIDDMFEMLENTVEMAEDYYEQSKFNINRIAELQKKRTATVKQDFSRNQSKVNVKTDCDSELNEYKKKHKDNEFDKRDESNANKSEDNEHSEDKESESSNYYNDKSNENNYYNDNKSEDGISNGDVSDSDYYDSNKDYSVTEDSEESEITGSDSYITPDFNSSGGCDCSNCGENSDCSNCNENSDYDESSEVSDYDSSSYCSDDCVCPSCRNIGYEEENESMSESGRDDLYEYETPESYESDIYGENTLEDGENVY